MKNLFADLRKIFSPKNLRDSLRHATFAPSTKTNRMKTRPVTWLDQTSIEEAFAPSCDKQPNTHRNYDGITLDQRAIGITKKDYSNSAALLGGVQLPYEILMS